MANLFKEKPEPFMQTMAMIATWQFDQNALSA